jgi:hypothetical protein
VHIEESLRVVPDEVFFAAQAKIARRAGCGGRPSHRGTSALPDIAAEVVGFHPRKVLQRSRRQRFTIGLPGV